MRGWSRKDLRDRHEKSVHAKAVCNQDKIEAEPGVDSQSVVCEDDINNMRTDDEFREFSPSELWKMVQEERSRCERLEEKLEALQRRYDEREDKWLDLIATRVGERVG